jgi:hypothetical protein
MINMLFYNLMICWEAGGKKGIKASPEIGGNDRMPQ